MRTRLWLILSLSLAGSAADPLIARAEPDLAGSRRLFLTGHYVEARESFARVAKHDPIAAAIGQARCWRAVGSFDRAMAILEAAGAAHPGSAVLLAELAQFERERGRTDAAQRHADASLGLDRDQPVARYVVAELHRSAGRLDQANDAYRWFIRYYNQAQDSIRDPEVFRCIGLGAAQYARWNRNSGQFHFLVNGLYPDALKLDPTYWPAHLEAALLFIEKYNLADAHAELDLATKINPFSAEVHAARGLAALQSFDLDSARAEIDRALAINPELLVAHQLAADVQLLVTGPRAAVPILEHARTLNPVDEETLGRLAATYGVIDGLRLDAPGTRMGAVITAATKRNEHCGVFYAAMGSTLALLTRFPHAARYYEEALRRMPQLVTIPGQLGLACMQTADETRARGLLEQALELDPFNQRVKTTLEVLRLLDGYATLETPHFRIRFDRDRDSLLARYAARYLEDEVYGPVVKEFGYAPPDKTPIEIFSPSKGVSGHSWFSRRMSGVPFIGPVAASTGKMVGLTSPSDGSTRFNWARVLKHEFVHVVTLQQTDFNITRWYTEGLAVRLEGSGRPKAWDAALARRVAANRLFNLATINHGFLRPVQLDDWMLAYYQSELYAQHLVDRFGRGALNKLIGAYADHLETGPALERCFGISSDAFEKGFRDYVGTLVTRPTTDTMPAPAKPMSMSALQRAVEEKPGDVDLRAQLALEFLKVNMAFRANDHANAALAINPRHPRAALALATAHLRAGEEPKALEVLRGAFDPNALDADMLSLFAALTLKTKDFNEAERLLLLGRERFPNDLVWSRLLANVYRGTGSKDKLADILRVLTAGDYNDLEARTGLAQLALDRGDFREAADWAEEALHIDVMNASAHVALARALAGSGRMDSALSEYGVAIGLEPGRLEWRLALAEACVAAKENARARVVLDELLARDSKYPGARELRARLGR